MSENIKQYSEQDKSKTLSKADDDGKQFLIDSLDGHTRGFDVDSIYVELLDNGRYRWTILELLKADTVLPEESHPRRYWSKNKHKFLSLWTLCESLAAGDFDVRLLLVNYRDTKSNVKVMQVKSMSEDTIETDPEHTFTFERWRQFYSNFNNTKKGMTWDVLDHLHKLKAELEPKK